MSAFSRNHHHRPPPFTHMRRSRTQDPLRAATRYIAFQPTRLSPASVRQSSSASTNPSANDSASSVTPPANLWTPRLVQSLPSRLLPRTRFILTLFISPPSSSRIY